MMARILDKAAVQPRRVSNPSVLNKIMSLLSRPKIEMWDRAPAFTQSLQKIALQIQEPMSLDLYLLAA